MSRQPADGPVLQVTARILRLISDEEVDISNLQICITGAGCSPGGAHLHRRICVLAMHSTTASVHRPAAANDDARSWSPLRSAASVTSCRGCPAAELVMPAEGGIISRTLSLLCLAHVMCMAQHCSGYTDGSLNLWHAGHSLGGALAELAAHSFAFRAQQNKSREDHGWDISRRMCCYTFGAPRTGNAAWAAEVEALAPATFHVINDQVQSSADHCGSELRDWRGATFALLLQSGGCMQSG